MGLAFALGVFGSWHAFVFIAEMASFGTRSLTYRVGALVESDVSAN
jgi:hypothetical protein